MAAKKTASKKATPKKTATKKPAAKKASGKNPIELYYWPTPNGWKVSIMLEECALPYKVKGVNIGTGAQFKPAFLKISPNNRMPAIIDPSGPGGKPISVFESGAILQYLARKTGKFYGKTERERVAVDEWLFWQMGGLGPMAGQANHFRLYAPAMTKKKIPYAIDRYTNEVNRLFGVMDKRLKKNKYLAGDKYTIADMACWGWVLPAERLGQNLKSFKGLHRWFKEVSDRPAVQAGFHAGAELRTAGIEQNSKDAAKARKILFGQKAKK